MILNIKQISNILSSNQQTMRNYLGNYRFSKYIVANRPLTVNVDSEFIKTFKNFTEMRYTNSALKINKRLDRLKEVLETPLCR